MARSPARTPSATAALRRGFNRRAAGYDQAARWTGPIATELSDRLQWLAFAPNTVLDLGAGTGSLSRALKARYPGAHVIALDISEAMLMRLRPAWWRPISRVHGDAQALPIRPGSIDLICSSLLLPWLVNPILSLAEALRALAPRGCLSFATLGPGSLAELAGAFSSVDECSHRNPLPDMAELAQLLSAAGFADPVLDIERETRHCASTLEVLQRAHGCGFVVDPLRRCGLLGRDGLERLEAAYERYRQPAGLPVTLEVIYGQAWRPGSAPPTRSKRGEVVVPITSIRR
jgi:malonyl-CoA O-methyltransferase